MFPVVLHAARHCPLLPYSLFILPANSFASSSVLSYAVSSSIFPLSSITHTTHFLLLMSIPIFLILFITSLRIVFDGSEFAITQRAKYTNATARILIQVKVREAHVSKGADPPHSLRRECFYMHSNCRYGKCYTNFSSLTWLTYHKIQGCLFRHTRWQLHTLPSFPRVT